MTKIAEIFGIPTSSSDEVDWEVLVERQHCPYTSGKCVKVRKSEPDLSIGTCSVYYGKAREQILICPNRLLARRQIFTDCLHLLTLHEPGNELHLIPEVSIPGGSVDYFLVSVNRGRVQDFVGIELQTLDTTGTVWPERQRFLDSVGLAADISDIESAKRFGMNWKMTAKTILIQLHHKTQTLEFLNKHLVLVIQDVFLDYLKREFQFDHLDNARLGNPMHFHAYGLAETGVEPARLELQERLSTDANGIALCLGLLADANVELENIVKLLESKLTNDTMLIIG